MTKLINSISLASSSTTDILLTMYGKARIILDKLTKTQKPGGGTGVPCDRCDMYMLPISWHTEKKLKRAHYVS